MTFFLFLFASSTSFSVSYIFELSLFVTSSLLLFISSLLCNCFVYCNSNLYPFLVSSNVRRLLKSHIKFKTKLPSPKSEFESGLPSPTRGKAPQAPTVEFYRGTRSRHPTRVRDSNEEVAAGMDTSTSMDTDTSA